MFVCVSGLVCGFFILRKTTRIVKGRGPSKNFKKSCNYTLFSFPLWSRKTGVENLPHISARKARCLYARNYRKEISFLAPFNDVSYTDVRAFYLALYQQTES